MKDKHYNQVTIDMQILLKKIDNLTRRIEALERFSLKGNKFEKIFVDGKEVKVYPNYSEIADD